MMKAPGITPSQGHSGLECAHMPQHYRSIVAEFEAIAVRKQAI
jgi:hypothetical protein